MEVLIIRHRPLVSQRRSLSGCCLRAPGEPCLSTLPQPPSPENSRWSNLAVNVHTESSNELCWLWYIQMGGITATTMRLSAVSIIKQKSKAHLSEVQL